MTQLLTWLGRDNQAQKRTRAIADAYVNWLAAEHPHVYDAHVAAFEALRQARTEAELAPRIARLDQLVARVA